MGGVASSGDKLSAQIWSMKLSDCVWAQQFPANLPATAARIGHSVVANEVGTLYITNGKLYRQYDNAWPYIYTVVYRIDGCALSSPPLPSPPHFFSRQPQLCRLPRQVPGRPRARGCCCLPRWEQTVLFWWPERYFHGLQAHVQLRQRPQPSSASFP